MIRGRHLDFGKDHLQLHELIAVTTAIFWRAFASQAQRRTGIGSFRDRHGYVTRRRRNPDPPTEHGLRKRHRKFQRDVIALARKAVVGQDLDFDERIARAALTSSGRAFSAQSKDLAVDQTRPDRHIERAAIPQGQAFVRTADRLRKFNREAILQILPSPVCMRPCTAPQKLCETVFRVHEICEAGTISVRMALIGGSEILIVFLPGPLRPGLVYLATVEALAFLRIAQQVVSAGDLFEFFFGLLVARIEIWVTILCQLAVCLLNIGGR